MKATQHLHGLGQSLWLDNLTRGLLRTGTMRRYRDELSLTGLTSNPTIFDQAIRNTDLYDGTIRRKAEAGASGEDLFFELAIEDLREAAELFRPIHDATQGKDGWVSLEVSPLLAYDTASTVREAKRLHEKAACPNLFIKIPGTEQGVPAIEESIYQGVPINVTLLFSCEHYLAIAEAYMRGIERRLAAGLSPVVPSVASLFISRWDKAVNDRLPDELHNQVGLAVAKRTYAAYSRMLSSRRWQRLAASGARRQLLLWASTGTKDPHASDVLYLTALAAPETIITIPEATLLAFAEHGVVGELLPTNGGDAEQVLALFKQAGIDEQAVASELQREGTEAFDESWADLMACLAARSRAVSGAATSAPMRKNPKISH